MYRKLEITFMYLKLENFVRRWRGLRVLVIGDAMLDVDMPVSGQRPSPEYTGGRVLSVKEGRPAAGGAANVAVNLAAMGAHVELIAMVGADANAHHLAACLVDGGVACPSLVEDWGRPTTTKTRLGKAVRLDCEATHFPALKAAQTIVAEIKDLAPHADAIILSDYGKGMLCPEVIAALAQLPHVFPIVWDPKATLHKRLPGVVTHVTPNLTELRQLTGRVLRSRARRRLRELMQGATLVITNGADGADVYTAGGTSVVQTDPVHNPDVRGAGDTFVAAFTLALAAGATSVQAAALGNAAARQAVLVKGTAAVTWADVLLQLPQVVMQNQRLLHASR